MNRGSTLRDLLCPQGNEDFPAVRRSNKMTSRSGVHNVAYTKKYRILNIVFPGTRYIYIAYSFFRPSGLVY